MRPLATKQPLADIADMVKNHADDCFITDFEDALNLWGIPCKQEGLHPFDAAPGKALCKRIRMRLAGP